MSFVHVHIKRKRNIFSAANVGECIVMFDKEKQLSDLLWDW
jgi:hypothetical protein